MLLGHHSPAFTLATYGHLLPNDLPEPMFIDATFATGEAEEDESGTMPGAVNE